MPGNDTRLHRRSASKVHIDLAQAVGHRAGLAVGDGLAVDRYHRLHEHGGAGDEGFLGRQRLRGVMQAVLAARRLDRVATMQ